MKNITKFGRIANSKSSNGLKTTKFSDRSR